MAGSSHLKRIDFVINTHLQAAWNRAGLERLDQTNSVRIEKNALALILSCDPSRSHRYGSWLARWRRQMWSIGGLRSMARIEDLELLSSALSEFDALRRHLPLARRDINQYQSAEEIFAAYQEVHPQEARIIREAERAAAYCASQVLFKKDKWCLVRLGNEQAARWWGRGTRWCTAAHTNNQFDAYASKGDILVLITPLGRYQLAKHTGEFRDAADQPATLTAVLRMAPSSLRHILLQ